MTEFRDKLVEILKCNCGSNDYLNDNHYDDCATTYVPAILAAIRELPSMRAEKYEELDYSRYENQNDTPWSKRQIKESRKQRMARVVTKNALRSKILAELGLGEVG